MARLIYVGLSKGEINRALFTSELNDYFTQQVIDDYAKSLGALGSPTEFTTTGESLRGGMTIRSYRVRAGGIVMSLVTMTLPNGLIDQFLVERAG